jgi:sugar O-acyltransferase (sialic acid O-acetyltransferase NeuD family)
MNKDAVIIGYSGHAYVILDILLSDNYNIIGYCDNEYKAENPFHLQYLGTENDKSILSNIEKCNIFIGIGNNKIRSQIFEKLIKRKINCPIAIHNRSTISQYAQVGSGSVIMAGAIINAMAQIGNAVICNTSSVIEHECIIGSYSHIAPGAVLAGNVTVGKNSFIGANSVVKQGVTIGSNVIIGAGSVILRNIPDGSKVYGNPARI